MSDEWEAWRFDAQARREMIHWLRFMDKNVTQLSESEFSAYHVVAVERGVKRDTAHGLPMGFWLMESKSLHELPERQRSAWIALVRCPDCRDCLRRGCAFASMVNPVEPEHDCCVPDIPPHVNQGERR